MAPSVREHGRGRHSDRWKGTFAITIDDIKHTDLTQAERDVLKADRERWERMGNSGHLYDWLDYHPGLSIRRRLAMRLAYTNRPEGKGYALAYNQLMRADGFDTNDKTMMSQMAAVLWICDIPEHKQILQEILDALSPGQRSRLNTPIAARQRIKTVLDAREHGTEEKVKEAPLTLAKQQLAEQNRKIARLEEQLAAAQNDASLFDLRRDSADHIIRVMTDPSTISEHKARTIATGILAGLKARSKPGG